MALQAVSSWWGKRRSLLALKTLTRPTWCALYQDPWPKYLRWRCCFARSCCWRAAAAKWCRFCCLLMCWKRWRKVEGDGCAMSQVCVEENIFPVAIPFWCAVLRETRISLCPFNASRFPEERVSKQHWKGSCTFPLALSLHHFFSHRCPKILENKLPPTAASFKKQTADPGPFILMRKESAIRSLIIYRVAHERAVAADHIGRKIKPCPTSQPVIRPTLPYLSTLH
ncbi:hypothetical protein B0H67DRAFT_90174 [Lasiosphaeris hirsuta]|uniref:Uncharacterized protein n=1 Tax=Lasiosphaeris hirsuta TaxID=260670 RepID=A0AA40BCU1_9PEZI|nr:hypothetical protein B0H67DRAFT_90174 [Lasiosphaeris hirsuta]